MKNTIFQLLPGAEGLPIKSLDGKATIAKAKDLFKSYIAPNFKEYDLDRPGSATKGTHMSVREMLAIGTFSEIFSDINADLDKVAMTQAQVIEFCKVHRAWLHRNHRTLFLIKKPKMFWDFFRKKVNKYFVVGVFVSPDSLSAFVLRLENDRVWYNAYRDRVVSLRL